MQHGIGWNQSFLINRSRTRAIIAALLTLLTVASAQAKSLTVDLFSDDAVSSSEKVIVEFSVPTGLANAIDTIALVNVATGDRFDISVREERQIVDLPAGVYRPDFKQMSHRIYGTLKETAIDAPEKTLLTIKPNAVTYLGKWELTQSKIHSGLFASIKNRKTSLSIQYGSEYQEWIAKDASQLMAKPLVTTRLGNGKLISSEWMQSDRAVVSN